MLRDVLVSVCLTTLLVAAATASYPPPRTYGHCYDRQARRWYDQGPIETPDACTYCVCNADRDIVCIAHACPPLHCPDPLLSRAGECCPRCPAGCDFREGWYGVGHIRSDNACEQCDCSPDGVVSCNAVMCPKLKCPEAYQTVPAGECCAVCQPGCDFRNNWYGVGHIQSDNACEQCDCNADGYVACNAVVCPKLKCPEAYQTVPEGECCAVCQPGCDFRYNWYGVGHIQTDNVCETCTCLADGSSQCIEKLCPRLYCPQSRQRVPEGECCPVCQPGCVHNGNHYGINDIVPSTQSYCQTCTCEDNDVIDCVRNPCPPTNCPARLKVEAAEGECCPSCLTGCVVDDTVYGVSDSVPSSDPCETCECGYGGEVSCRPVECEDPGYCRYGRHTPYGQCCPVCRSHPRNRSNLAFLL